MESSCVIHVNFELSYNRGYPCRSIRKRGTELNDSGFWCEKWWKFFKTNQNNNRLVTVSLQFIGRNLSIQFKSLERDLFILRFFVLFNLLDSIFWITISLPLFTFLFFFFFSMLEVSKPHSSLVIYLLLSLRTNTGTCQMSHLLLLLSVFRSKRII